MDEATTQFSNIYWAEIKSGETPVIRCYFEPFPRGQLSLGFNLNYNNGKYEIGDIETDYKEI
ncbi:hypothetical protein [Butyrivibrio sp. AE3004]|uniref:hypothetical protein n=1 Tax=Butyrivibrio sp. AE3004 TaxID=1506994 RepID=UPI000494C9CD|nr:hypothetical protein [Butyrivibrio sp. AE3004]